MTYVRHRTRQVQESVIADVNETLGAYNWIGATPLALIAEHPLQIVDYFPEDAIAQGEIIAPNTLAIDQGVAEEPLPYELGSMLMTQAYTFNFAFFADSDAVAHALLQDLSDRYHGMPQPPAFDPAIRWPEAVALYDYLTATPTLIVNMEIEAFRWAKSPNQVVPDADLYFAELILTDFLED